MARSITDPDWQAQALAVGRRAGPGRAARAGRHHGPFLTAADQQAQALVVMAAALARAGQHEQAATMARSISTRTAGAALAAVPRQSPSLATRTGRQAQARSITSRTSRRGRWQRWPRSSCPAHEQLLPGPLHHRLDQQAQALRRWRRAAQAGSTSKPPPWSAPSPYRSARRRAGVMAGGADAGRPARAGRHHARPISSRPQRSACGVPELARPPAQQPPPCAEPSRARRSPPDLRRSACGVRELARPTSTNSRHRAAQPSRGSFYHHPYQQRSACSSAESYL